MVGFFKNNRDLDSTILVVFYGIVLVSHVFLSAYVENYGSSDTATKMSEYLANIGLVIFGALFRKGGEQPTNGK